MKPFGDLFGYRTCSPPCRPPWLTARAGAALSVPSLVFSVWDGSRKPACVFVESPQQAVAGAISASFTGGTAQAFHLGQGYGFVPPEQRETMHHRLDQTLQAKAAVCMCVQRGGALSTTFITAVDWVVLTEMHIKREGKDFNVLSCNL